MKFLEFVADNDVALKTLTYVTANLAVAGVFVYGCAVAIKAIKPVAKAKKVIAATEEDH